jgi:hypothetical protein
MKKNHSCFSFFNKPISNCTPHPKPVYIAKVHQFIAGHYFQKQTEYLRSIRDEKEARQYKSRAFDYVTFSGLFTYRNEQSLIKHSGLITIDLDHISAMLYDHKVFSLKKEILSSKEIEIALCFVSPGGDGLKIIAEIDIVQNSHKEWFEALSNYFETNWKIKPDPSGSDVSRPCFLPFDPECYINPKYLN